ncbi:MAG: hypothetical protein ATN31_08225 [Candidatus Epulonipiscioides saccharophilum]|nr:MAG: hypothetical protein ATN31_08225 [Epulopiscium sp. AS2M-Bin001]
MNTALDNFKKICSIPHGSGNEKALSDFLLGFAKDLGLKAIQDNALNLYIYKSASPGYENSTPIILQGHLDMVCEKDSSAPPDFDFEKDPLNIQIQDDFIFSQGTTLGADDAFALAYQMSILEDSSLKHPPLCMLMTSEEETGMAGVVALDPNLIKGHTLINLDTDLEGEFLTSCAGGIRINLTINGVKISIPPGEALYDLKISGLKSGHSGAEIHKERANANVLMARVLDLLNEKFNIGLSSINGGQKDNVITKECLATITISTDKYSALSEYLKEIEKMLQLEYSVQDPDLTITLEPASKEISAEENATEDHEKFMIDSKLKIINLLRILPNGVVAKSRHIENLVETSLNIGVVSTAKNVVSVTLLIRSSLESKKIDLKRKIKSIAKIMDIQYSENSDYPAWQFNEHSKIRAVAKDTYQKFYNKEPVIKAIHAGLECGILSEKIDNLDAISLGPDVYDIHTSKERMNISSFNRVYTFLIKLLEDMR